MTWDECVKAIADHGSPNGRRLPGDRHAHSGCALGGTIPLREITHGQKVQDFFRKVVAASTRRRVAAGTTGPGFTTSSQPMYEAIGEPDNRHRRASSESRVERLMDCSTLSRQRDLQWLATGTEKVAYFNRAASSVGRICHRTFSSDAEKQCAGYGQVSDRHWGRWQERTFFVLVTRRCLPTSACSSSATGALAGAASLVRPRLIPHHLSSSMNRYQEAFREQVGSPLRPTQLQELRWFFEARRSGSSKREDGQFDRAKRAFGTRGFGFSTALGRAGRPQCWTRSSRPLWRLRSRVRPANSKHANWCIGISISLLWQARRDPVDTSCGGRREGR